MASKKTDTQKTKSSKKETGSKRAEPQTMADLMATYGETVHGYTSGDRVTGKVVEIAPHRMVLDIGGKSEGIVAEKAFKEAEKLIKGLKVGDVVEGSVIVPETSDGYTIISLRTAQEDSNWEKVEEAFEAETPLKVFAKHVNSAGIVVDVAGLSGFVPKSQIGQDMFDRLDDIVGKKFEAKIIDMDRKSRKVVLSEKEVSEAQSIELEKRALETVKEGETYKGEVTTVYDFGVFVRVNVKVEGEDIPLEGLVHVSELSWEKQESPKKLLSVRDKVEVRVLGKKDDKLALSMKQAQEDPWQKASGKYPKDTKTSGKVTRISDYGVFVQLESGIDGLIHMTKIPPGKKLEEGETVNVYVEDVDTKARKLSLGLVLTAKPVGYR